MKEMICSDLPPSWQSDAYNEQDDDAADAAAVLAGLASMGAQIGDSPQCVRRGFHVLLDVAGADAPPTPDGAVTVNFLMDEVRPCL